LPGHRHLSKLPTPTGQKATKRLEEALKMRADLALAADRRRGMKSPVEALLFDLGRVVIDLDATRALARWTALAGVAATALSQPLAAAIAGGEAFRRHERGEISDAAFFAHLRQQLKIELTDAQFVDGWNAIFIGEMPGIRRVLASVCGQLPLYAFSNTNTAHYAHWSLRFADLLAPFRKIYVSHQLGARKPEPAAFQAVIADMGIGAPRVLFFDDLAENVAGARACGLMAAQVKSASDVEQVLSEMGLGP
jgi:glucose-1-phosphatase